MLLVPDSFATDKLQIFIQEVAGTGGGHKIAVADYVSLVRDQIIFVTQLADQVGSRLDLGVSGFHVFKITAKVDADGVAVTSFRMCTGSPFRAACFDRPVFPDDIMVAAASPSVHEVHGVNPLGGQVIINKIAGVVHDNHDGVRTA